MLATSHHCGITLLLPAAALALMLPAERVQAQGRLQTRQQSGCQQNGGQARLSGQRQLNTLQNRLQTAVQQLNALQQSGQLTAAQLQAVSQLQSALQNALQQLGVSQNGTLTASQVQALGQLRAAPIVAGR